MIKGIFLDFVTYSLRQDVSESKPTFYLKNLPHEIFVMYLYLQSMMKGHLF